MKTIRTWARPLLASLALTLLLAAPALAVEYRGNPDSMIFHHPNCQHYSSAAASETFNSREKAVMRGFKACKLCFVEKDGKLEARPARHGKDGKPDHAAGKPKKPHKGDKPKHDKDKFSKDKPKDKPGKDKLDKDRLDTDKHHKPRPPRSARPANGSAQ